MNTYRVTVTGTARELYVVRAESEEKVHKIFECGDAPVPVSSEVYDAEIVGIELEDS